MTRKFDNLLLTGYKITYNPAELDAENGITPEIRNQLDKTRKKISKGVKNLNSEIEMLIIKYPHIPQFKNYLATYYSQNRQHEKAIEINNRILEEHPDYLFGKINLAKQYMQLKQFSRVPEILGDGMEIKSLYPERETFHVEEVLSFFQTAVNYFIETDDTESAEIRIQIMTEIDKDHVKTIKASEDLAIHKFRKETENLKLPEISPEIPKLISKTKYRQTKKEPVFIHPEIKLLYQYGFQIDFNIIKNLIELPRESLIEDLRKVVNDGISRYKYFKKETNWEFHTHSFVFHALLLLAELNDEDSLNTVLDLLRQNEKLLDYWLSDAITEEIWKTIFVLGHDQLDVLRNFILEEGNYTYARTAVSQAVTQIALHNPERRKEVIQWYYIILNYFLEHKDNEEIIDDSLIGLIVCDLLDLKALELEETIVELYRYGLAATGCAGFLKEVLEDLHSKSQMSFKNKLPTIKEVYKEFADWERSIEKRSAAVKMEEKNIIKYPELPEIYKNTGRNEKCPCGSGLKFKKCHGKVY